MSELWQNIHEIEAERVLELRRILKWEEEHRFRSAFVTSEDRRRAREDAAKNPPKPDPELDRKLAELEADFKSSRPEAEARRQKAREAYQKWFDERKARADKALEIIQASREKANGEVETL
ncbi:hypothetical protein [Acidaminococcus sp.]|uniref:hypothetical protein n=1 Tax=Acidaminococcus sp. TaxID=1872103 RepID=UPI00352223FD